MRRAALVVVLGAGCGVGDVGPSGFAGEYRETDWLTARPCDAPPTPGTFDDRVITLEDDYGAAPALVVVREGGVPTRYFARRDDGSYSFRSLQGCDASGCHVWIGTLAWTDGGALSIEERNYDCPGDRDACVAAADAPGLPGLVCAHTQVELFAPQ